ncbi:hypothetical protein A2U01_0090529, partial [Trifolium medium]|nr:hypothetical protein [Trifolium medium]
MEGTQTLGIRRPDHHLWDQRDCKVNQGSVPGRELLVSISVHPLQDSHCRLARRALYCPSEDEVLHEQ